MKFIITDDPISEANIFYDQNQLNNFEKPNIFYSDKGKVNCTYMSSHDGFYIKKTRIYLNKKVYEENDKGRDLCFLGGYFYHAGQKQIFNKGFDRLIDDSYKPFRGIYSNNSIRWLYGDDISVGNLNKNVSNKIKAAIGALGF